MSVHELFQTTHELPPHERYTEKLSPGSSHAWALATLRELPRLGNLLDIGPGSGIIAQHLYPRERPPHPASESGNESPTIPHMVAVEPDRSSWDHLTPLYPRLVADIDDLPAEERFDTVLLLDVLEHVVTPGQLLASAVVRLKPEGHLLVSVPNIAHIAIRLVLLAGFFPRMAKGPLDRTHLHFFTRTTIRSLLASCSDLEILTEWSSIAPLELLLPPSIRQTTECTWFWRLTRRLHIELARLLPGFFGYQILFLLRKRSKSGNQNS